MIVEVPKPPSRTFSIQVYDSIAGMMLSSNSSWVTNLVEWIKFLDYLASYQEEKQKGPIICSVLEKDIPQQVKKCF